MSSTEENQEKPAVPIPLPKPIEEGIGRRIKAARENAKGGKGLSQTELHNLTGLSRTVLINYEAGRHIPGVRELRLLCDALEVSPNQLIYGTEDPMLKSESFADAILSAGPSAVVSFQVLSLLLPAILGKDDTRIILEMIGSLLKAKSPEGYADVMSVVQATKLLSENANMKDQAKVEELFADQPEALEFLRDYRKRINSFQEKASKP